MLKQGECRAIVSSDLVAVVREQAPQQCYDPTKPRFIVQLIHGTECGSSNAVCINLDGEQTIKLRDFLNAI